MTAGEKCYKIIVAEQIKSFMRKIKGRKGIHMLRRWISKKNIAAAMAAMLAFVMAGCGENAIPEMTKEEIQAVGEYAAITLMKYDASKRSRLVNLPETAKPETDVPKTPVPEQKPSGMGPVDNTPVVDVSQNNADDSDDLNEALELAQGINVIYQGETVCARYPMDKEVGFGVPASKGNKLLVMNFLVANDTGEEQVVDLNARKITIRMTVNKEFSKWVLPAVLPNDLLTLDESIPAGGSVEAVLLVEIDENLAADIQTISFHLKNGENAYTIYIK